MDIVGEKGKTALVPSLRREACKVNAVLARCRISPLWGAAPLETMLWSSSCSLRCARPPRSAAVNSHSGGQSLVLMQICRLYYYCHRFCGCIFSITVFIQQGQCYLLNVLTSICLMFLCWDRDKAH